MSLDAIAGLLMIVGLAILLPLCAYLWWRGALEWGTKIALVVGLTLMATGVAGTRLLK